MLKNFFKERRYRFFFIISLFLYSCSTEENSDLETNLKNEISGELLNLYAVDSWGSAGTGSGQYMGSGSIIAGSGYIYISSRDGSGISKFDTNGNIMSHRSSKDIRQINFKFGGTKIYGYEQNSMKVTIFNLDLSDDSTDNSSVSSGDHGLATDQYNNVFISGYQNNFQVSKFSDNGNLGLSLVSSWGSQGESLSQFSNPQYIHDEAWGIWRG